jgi:hypothetical protein
MASQSGLRARVTLTGPLTAPPRLLRAIEDATDAMLLRVGTFGERIVKDNTPVGWHGAASGLRGSIFHELTGRPSQRGVLITHGMAYGDIVEFGRRPGKRPPFDPIWLWVRRKIGLTGPAAYRFARYVQDKIGRSGYAGFFMFKRSFPVIEDEFNREGEILRATVARILTTGQA